MITLIQNGESQEKYATWAKSAPQSVRLALAENKYELDRLSKDEDPVIVVTVMKKSKEHLRKIMQSAIKSNSFVAQSHTMSQSTKTF